ncbi:MAG: ABC transporter C-terminal domain-containing protein, partial [Ruthenibacterium sp.]
IDDDIAALEAKITACTAQVAAAASDYVRLAAAMAEKDALEAELETKTERWVYLNELAEKIEAGE